MAARVEAFERQRRGSAPDRDAGAGTPVSTRLDICGIPVDAVTEAEAAERIVDAAVARRPLQVCTVNLQFLLSGVRDRRVRRILRNSGLNVADGAPLLWLARLGGSDLPQRVAGADLVPRVMDAAAARGLGVFLLGGRGVVDEAAETLRLRHPGLRVVGTCEPPLAPAASMDSEAILAAIRESGADIVLVAFGHPRQELWIAANRNALAAPVAIGVGCTLDLLAGRRSRAPLWMREAGLEWLFRLAHEPRRLWARYATQVLWLGTVLAPAAAAQGRRRRPLPALPGDALRPAPGADVVGRPAVRIPSVTAMAADGATAEVALPGVPVADTASLPGVAAPDVATPGPSAPDVKVSA